MTKSFFIIPLLITSLLLAGCGSVEEVSYSSIVVDGTSYELRTRTIDGPTGSYQTTSAIVGNKPYLCRIESPGDCAAAVRRGRDEVEDPR